jgi:hypothetical protein
MLPHQSTIHATKVLAHLQFCIEAINRTGSEDYWHLATTLVQVVHDRLCGLVVTVPRYRYEVGVQFPELPGFLGSMLSGKESTQSREYELRSYLKEKVAAPV